MGLDFIRRTKATFQKAWAKGYGELVAPQLFRGSVSEPTRAVQASVLAADLQVGERLQVLADDGALVLYRDLTPVARIERPPPNAVEALRQSGGVACARVERVSSITSTAEVEL